MTSKQALAFVRAHRLVLESARGPVPNLAEAVAGERIRGSWWTHPKANHIFLLSRTIRASPDVLVCRLVSGKVTFVHRDAWPALVSLAGRFPLKRLTAIKEVHTAAGKHQLVITPFPDWVPNAVLRAARMLSLEQATTQLAAILDAPAKMGKDRRGKKAAGG